MSPGFAALTVAAADECALPAPGAVLGRFVDALAARDPSRLDRLLDPDARLRALVPSGLKTETGARAVMAIFLRWFGGADRLEVAERTVYPVGDRFHLRYRFRELYDDGRADLIEQDIYAQVTDGRIVSMDLLCSGHRPSVGPASPEPKQFDAGELGCGSGLPQAFRQQIESVPVGGTLEVFAHDPAAREDLPSLARLLGHRVVELSDTPRGTRIRVERGR